MTCVVELVGGDCVDRMREMDAASVDAIVCDPPYLIGFMGKEFDSQHKTFVERRSRRRAGSFESEHGNHNPANSADKQRTLLAEGRRAQAWHERWAVEAFRVLKPGGHLLAFGGTRTYHRLAAGLEDAGFEIRDTIAWMYGSGFPKSLDVSKAIDKAQGVEREVVGQSRRCVGPSQDEGYLGTGTFRGGTNDLTVPATPEAESWQGWGTALKPAFEPIVVARKPLVGTVAANVLAFGAGAINVDACRVGFASPEDEAESKEKNRHGDFETPQGGNAVYGDYSMLDPRENYDPPGRWPANVLLGHSDGCVQIGAREVSRDLRESLAEDTEGKNTYGSGGPGGGSRAIGSVPEMVEVWECVPDCPVRLLDEQTGELHSQDPATRNSASPRSGIIGFADSGLHYPDRGGASRFFYCAKTSRAERSAGLSDDFEERMLRWSSGEESPGTFQSEGTEKSARNHHPTVKPIELMRWLIRLVTPPGGTVLDPFVGSGSTGCAAVLELAVGRFVGIEREPDYLAIAEARVRFWQENGEAALDVVRARQAADRRRDEIAESGQLDLLA